MNLRLDWCSHEAAKYAVENWHYSGTMPAPPVIKIGVWEDNVFIGCVLFSRGNTTNLGTAYGLTMQEVCELSRIALTKHANSVTRVISVALKMLHKKEKGLRLVVSFADTNEGHHGGIYQGSNWVYCGVTNGGYKFIYKGIEYHSRQVSSNGINIQFGNLRRVPKISNCERIPQKPKHRYLYPLDDAMRAQIAPLAKPYPKRGTGETDNAAHSYAQIEGASPIVPLLNHGS